MQIQHDLTFIRHGQSLKNEAAHKYQISKGHNSFINWDLYMMDPQFKNGIIYSPDYIDSNLSETGRKQCQAARQKMKDYNPDVIFVSPLHRALETCSIIFGNRDVPVIVEPLISQTFKHTSEICKNMDQKKKQFPKFDYSRVDEEGQFWFIKNDSFENQQKYFKVVQKVQSQYYHEKIKAIIQFMQEQRMNQHRDNVRERASKVKKILKEYRKKYNKIAIVSHFFTIRFLCCKQFDENGYPIDKLCFQNTQSYETSLEEILKSE